MYILKKLKIYFLVVSALLLQITTANVNGGHSDQDDDAVVIEAAINVQVNLRGSKHLLDPYLDIDQEIHHVNRDDETAVQSCITNTGHPGKCSAFENCFPLRHLITEPEEDFLNAEIRTDTTNNNCTSGDSQDICCPEPPKLTAALKGSPVAGRPMEMLRTTSCGKSKVAHTKIVNGTETTPGEFPWMVVMFGKSGKQTCGGTLVSDSMVLTAAHCINSYTAQDVSKIRLFIGDHNIRSTSDGKHEVRGVKRIIKHKYFNIQSFVNDMALLRLDKPVTFSPRIQPICLPPPTRNNLAGKKLIVAGWGRTAYGGPTSNVLQKVSVRVWTNSNCENVYKGIAPGGILKNMICAGDKGLDSCVGDSGGPLVHEVHPGQYEQIGIVSFGKGCGTHPGVYTRVTEFLTWISANINK